MWYNVFMDKLRIQKDNNYIDVQNSTFGLYGYFNKNGTCIYVGIDSNIHKHARHVYHTSPSKRGEQRINRYLQSDAAHSVTYAVLCICRDEVEMKNMEVMYILFFKALGQCRFNEAVDVDDEIADELSLKLKHMKRN